MVGTYGGRHVLKVIANDVLDGIISLDKARNIYGFLDATKEPSPLDRLGAGM
jgi:hypothetical protein